MFKNVPGKDLILASSSPRRREFLSRLGIEFHIVTTDCDESVLPGEMPEALVTRLSLLKASIVAKDNPNSWVIGADTVVSLDDKIIGKPDDPTHAREILEAISGRDHEVWGAFSLLNIATGKTITKTTKTVVTVSPALPDYIDAYIATGEPLDKAGAFSIQGHGAVFIERISGSYTNVVGLDMPELVKCLVTERVIEV